MFSHGPWERAQLLDFVNMSDKVDYYLDFSPSSMEVNGRTMTFDTLFLPSSRGLIKVFEILLCFTSMLLIASSQGVLEERNFSLFVSFLGLSCSFSLLISYILMLNTKISQFAWFLMEAIYYIVMIVLLLLSGIFMAYFCAAYWSHRNPAWHTVPSLAAGTLIVTMLVFIVDLILLLRYWKRYSWHPSTDYSPQQLHWICFTSMILISSTNDRLEGAYYPFHIAFIGVIFSTIVLLSYVFMSNDIFYRNTWCQLEITSYCIIISLLIYSFISITLMFRIKSPAKNYYFILTLGALSFLLGSILFIVDLILLLMSWRRQRGNHLTNTMVN